MYIPTLDDMQAARDRIRPHVHMTPVLTSSFIDDLTGAELFFKCENFQKAAAFKVRGACNAVFGLSDEEATKGVATHSSGNHALSLSYAAGRRGIPCHVVMPRTAPQAKKDAVVGYGGSITECEPSTSSREETFEKVQAETGSDFVTHGRQQWLEQKTIDEQLKRSGIDHLLIDTDEPFVHRLRQFFSSRDILSRGSR